MRKFLKANQETTKLRSGRLISLMLITILVANLFLTLLCGVKNTVSAVSAKKSEKPESVLEEYAQNNILFYDPYECGPGDKNGTKFCTVPSGSDITWIGDSGSALAHDEDGYGLIERSFPGVDYGPSFDDSNSYIQSCKKVRGNGCGDVQPNPSGLEILKKIIDEGKLRKYLVFDLGSNGGWDDSMMEEFLGLVGDDTQVIFVPTGSDEDDYYAGINKILRDTANAHSNIYVADMAAEYKREYFDDSGIEFNIEGSKKFIQTIKDALPKTCTAGLLPGNTVGEKVWNYFVRLNEPGLSDNPAAIAGIIGNFMDESGLDPLIRTSGNMPAGGFLYGALDLYYGPLKQELIDAGLEKYFHTGDGGDIPEEAVDLAIKIELDYLVEKATRFSKNGDPYSYMNAIDVVSSKTPESYAELWLVSFEGAVGTVDWPGEELHDSGVRGLAQKWFGQTDYQDVNKRMRFAREAYDEYVGMATPTTTNDSGSMTSEGSNITAASSGGYNKYDDLTDAELWDLAEVAMNENSANITAFRNELSIMANLFEYYSDKPVNGHNLWDYIGNGGWFATSKYINGKHDQEISANYLDAARDILMKGNRTLPTQILEHYCVGDLEWVEINGEKHNASNPGNCAGQGLNDNSYYVAGQTKIHDVYGSTYIFYGWMGGEAGVGDPMGYFEDNPPTDTVASNSQNNGNCPDDSKGSGLGGEQIAQAAVKMAWPVQAGQGDDSHVGECEESSGNWITFTTAERPCKTNARAFYREQLIEQGRRQDGMDCGVYIGTVLQYVGAIDNITSTYDMEGDYFEPSDEWEQIENNGVESMKPGDVLLANGAALGHSTGHILFYIGDYGGSYGNIADASLDERVAQVGNIYNDTVWHIWRYKGGIGDGLTPEQAEQLASNYNNNVGNWDGTVAAEGNYCQGSSCASRYSNCTLFSAFFAEMFAGVGQRGWPDGINVVDTLKELGFETGTEPKPFAVFSTNTYHTPSGNHTGVVVGVQGSSIATIEAGYPSLNATYFDYTDVSGENIWYAYLDSELDYTKLMNYINQ